MKCKLLQCLGGGYGVTALGLSLIPWCHSRRSGGGASTPRKKTQEKKSDQRQQTIGKKIAIFFQKSG